MSSPSMKSYMKAGFGVGLGSAGAMMLLLAFGVLFFVPGFILLNKEQKKPKDRQRSWIKVIAFIMMGIGMIVGLGFGAGSFLSEIGQEL